MRSWCFTSRQAGRSPLSRARHWVHRCREPIARWVSVPGSGGSRQLPVVPPSCRCLPAIPPRRMPYTRASSSVKLHPLLQSLSDLLRHPYRRRILRPNQTDHTVTSHLLENIRQRRRGRPPWRNPAPTIAGESSRSIPGRAIPAGQNGPMRPTNSPLARSTTAQGPKPSNLPMPHHRSHVAPGFGSRQRLALGQMAHDFRVGQHVRVGVGSPLGETSAGAAGGFPKRNHGAYFAAVIMISTMYCGDANLLSTQARAGGLAGSIQASQISLTALK